MWVVFQEWKWSAEGRYDCERLPRAKSRAGDKEQYLSTTYIITWVLPQQFLLMAPISTPQSTNTQDVVDQIERQFTLSPESLVDLTKAFLNEFELGLGSYGQPMAMMYVPFLICFAIADRSLVRRSSLASPMAQKPGEWADPVIILTIIKRPLLALSWHLILEVPTCALAVEYLSTVRWRTAGCRRARRVCEVILNGDKTFNLVQQKFKVSEALKSGEASTLFGGNAAYLINSF